MDALVATRAKDMVVMRRVVSQREEEGARVKMTG